MSKILTTEQVQSKLKEFEGWSFENDSISKKFSFGNFKEAMAFMVRVGFEAEAQGHHPEFFNVYNTVKITLRTHDAGDKVTQKDIDLAAAAEEVAA